MNQDPPMRIELVPPLDRDEFGADVAERLLHLGRSRLTDTQFRIMTLVIASRAREEYPFIDRLAAMSDISHSELWGELMTLMRLTWVELEGDGL